MFQKQFILIISEQQFIVEMNKFLNNNKKEYHGVFNDPEKPFKGSIDSNKKLIIIDRNIGSLRGFGILCYITYFVNDVSQITVNLRAKAPSSLKYFLLFFLLTILAFMIFMNFSLISMVSPIIGLIIFTGIYSVYESFGYISAFKEYFSRFFVKEKYVK